ncbi:MAG: hypothetical protein NT038_01990 [Euryarchaeota archaeon]|nr:hypothetical protein [Euryarchaeota archaeon]
MVREDDIETTAKVGHASNLMERLQQASNEISTIKNSFSKSMDDLEKIQSVLSLDGINKFNDMLQEFEHRLSDSERKREEASQGARRYSEELEKEKERLMKLWDAYKTQEEELSSQERKAGEFEDNLREIEQSKMQLEKDLTARVNTLTKRLEETEIYSRQAEELRQKVQKFDEVHAHLEQNIRGLREELHSKDEIIKSLNSQIDVLKGNEQFAEFKTKFEDVSQEYEKEKERLTKLFRLYEETEAESNIVKKELKEWQDWFGANEELFNRLFSSAEHLRKQVTTVSSSASMQTPAESVAEETDSDTEHKQKTTKRLRFRK